MTNKKSFAQIILQLKQFWQTYNVTPIEGYAKEVGAGTLAPFTALQLINSKPVNISYVQRSLRPTDYRFAQNPNRAGGYYQFQCLIKPIDSVTNIQNLVVKSFEAIGVDLQLHDIRFIEDNWQNESIGASGLGYEVWCDGMEVAQFTYIQKIGGKQCDVHSCEITYGLERIAMSSQNCSSMFDIVWDYNEHGEVLYNDIHSKEAEIEYSNYIKNFDLDNDHILLHLNHKIEICKQLIDKKLRHPAYDACLEASHNVNILDGRGFITPQERMAFILQIKNLMNHIIELEQQ